MHLSYTTTEDERYQYNIFSLLNRINCKSGKEVHFLVRKFIVCSTLIEGKFALNGIRLGPYLTFQLSRLFYAPQV